MKQDHNHTNKKVMSGIFWKFAERILAQGTSFLISVVLARLMMPEDYGIVAIVLVFISIANVFITQGFSQSLIQKKDADEVDFSTVFYCSFGKEVKETVSWKPYSERKYMKSAFSCKNLVSFCRKAAFLR